MLLHDMCITYLRCLLLTPRSFQCSLWQCQCMRHPVYLSSREPHTSTASFSLCAAASAAYSSVSIHETFPICALVKCTTYIQTSNLVHMMEQERLLCLDVGLETGHFYLLRRQYRLHTCTLPLHALQGMANMREMVRRTHSQASQAYLQLSGMLLLYAHRFLPCSLDISLRV